MAAILRKISAHAAFMLTAFVVVVFPFAYLALFGKFAVGGAFVSVARGMAYSLMLAIAAVLLLYPLSMGYAMQRYQIPPSRIRRFLTRGLHMLKAIPPLVCAAAVILPVISLGGRPSFVWAIAAIVLALLPQACSMADGTMKAIPEKYYLAGVSLGASGSEAMLGVILRMAGRQIRANALLLLSMALDQMALFQLTLGFAAGLSPVDAMPLPSQILSSNHAGDLPTAALCAMILLVLSTLFAGMSRRMAKEAP